MADNKLTIRLTSEQQKQIKDASGKDVTTLILDRGELSQADLDQVASGKLQKQAEIA